MLRRDARGHTHFAPSDLGLILNNLLRRQYGDVK